MWRICTWILGLKGLRFEQWLIVGGFWSDVFTTITTTTTITVIYLTTLSSKSTSVHSKITPKESKVFLYCRQTQGYIKATILLTKLQGLHGTRNDEAWYN